jgi:hypothetical protein
MYYRYLTVRQRKGMGKPKGSWIEFHLGWDKEEVKNGGSLSRAIWLGANSYAIGDFLKQCEEDIDLHDMQRAG